MVMDAAQMVHSAAMTVYSFSFWYSFYYLVAAVKQIATAVVTDFND